MARDLKLTEAEAAALETWRAEIGARSAVDVLRALLCVKVPFREVVVTHLRNALPVVPKPKEKP